MCSPCAYIRPTDSPVAQLPPALTGTLTYFRALPLYIEESTPIYNEVYTDGWWGNSDQVTVRHDKGGHIGYMDGTVELFRQRSGPNHAPPATAAALSNGEQPSVVVGPARLAASTAATTPADTLGVPIGGPNAAVPN